MFIKTKSRSHRRSVLSLLALALLSSIVPLAEAAPSGTRDETIAGRPSATPASRPAPPPVYNAEDARISSMISAMAAAASVVAKRERRSLDEVADVDMLQARDIGDSGDTLLGERALSCLDSSATDVDINSLFHYGGAGTTVWLCPGARISITNSIFFTAPNQMLATQGRYMGLPNRQIFLGPVGSLLAS